MRLKRNHPWNPGYALPANLYGELDDNAQVSPMRPRGTYDDPTIPSNWDGGYALPGSVRGERPGQNARVTPGSRWGTGGRPAPSEFASTALEGLGALPRFGPTKGSKLAKAQVALGSKVRLGTPDDPIARFGTEGAAAVMQAANSAAQPGERIKVLRAMLNAIDPAMWNTVADKMAKAKARGIPAKQGLPKAVAAALANHFAKQLIVLGKAGKVPLSGVLNIVHQGDDAHAHQVLGGYLAAEGFEGLGWNPFSAVTKAVGKGLSATGGAIKDAAKATGGAIKDAAKATGGAIKDSAKFVYDKAKDGLNALGNLACKASKAGLLAPIAGAAGMAAGGPAGAQAGAQGAALVGTLCGSDGAPPAALVPQTPSANTSSGGMSTTTMLLLGGGALGVLFLVMR